MSNRKVSDGVYLLEGRASYPHLFVERVFDGNPSGYGMTLLLDKQKDKEAIALVAEGIKDVLRESFEGKKLHAERLCMRDGDLAAKDGYEGCMFVSANSKGRPYVLAPDGVTLVTDPVKEPVIYGGCRVTAKISSGRRTTTSGETGERPAGGRAVPGARRGLRQPHPVTGESGRGVRAGRRRGSLRARGRHRKRRRRRRR